MSVPTTAYTLSPLATSRRLLQTLTTNEAASKAFSEFFKVDPSDLVVLRDPHGGMILGKTEYLSELTFPPEAFLPEGKNHPSPTKAFALTPLGMGRKLLETLTTEEGAKKTFAGYFDIPQEDIFIWADGKGGIVGGKGDGVEGLRIFKQPV